MPQLTRSPGSLLRRPNQELGKRKAQIAGIEDAATTSISVSPVSMANVESALSSDEDDEMLDSNDFESEDSELDEDEDDESMSSTGDVSSSSASSEKEEDLQKQLRKLPLGALAAAQQASSLSESQAKQQQRSHRTETTPQKTAQSLSTDAERTLKMLRERLATLKDRSNPSTTNTTTSSHTHRHASAPTSKSTHTRPTPRTSKNAPTSLPSNKPITRFRPIYAPSLTTPAAKARDPRFSSLSGHVPSDAVLRSRYGFLDGHLSSEIDALKGALRDLKKGQRGAKSKAKLPGDEAHEAELKVEIQRRENKLRARRERDRHADVKARLKREEREKVRSGKRPFFAKRGVLERAVREEREGERKGKRRRERV